MKVIQLFKIETQLIKKAIKSNREAQHIIYEMYAPKMLSVCRYYVKDLQYAEDVLLNGFFKVFLNLKKFNNRGSFEGWIRKIMVREAISFLRKKNRIEFLIEDTIVFEKNSTAINTEFEIAEIQELIDDLPDGYKIVFIMFAIEGYKHHEIAEILKINIGTSKSQLYKARKMLQEKIKKLYKTNYDAI